MPLGRGSSLRSVPTLLFRELITLERIVLKHKKLCETKQGTGNNKVILRDIRGPWCDIIITILEDRNYVEKFGNSCLSLRNQVLVDSCAFKY